MMGVRFFVSNGRVTNAFFEKARLVKDKALHAHKASNYWSSSENSQNNAWIVNFSSGNMNNNNKYNSNYVRFCAALDEERIEAWVDAFDDCCRNKKISESCTKYRLDYEYDLLKLAYEVESGDYEPSDSIAFCVTRPKLREVFAANFRDRIVHHWLMLKLNNLFEDEFARGGNKALQRDIKTVSKGYDEDAYVGRFDIVGFFMSIDKDILIRMLDGFIAANYKADDIDIVSRTLYKIIRHNPAKKCDIHGDEGLFDMLPDNKTLFKTPEGKGLPIGNLTSQILANFYLSGFDMEMLGWCASRGGRYGRFVDDFYVVLPRMEDVKEAYGFAGRYLSEKLILQLHDDKKYMQHYTKGVKFVGYVVKVSRIYLSNRTYGKMYDKLRETSRRCEKCDEMKICTMLSHAVQSINSYIGFSSNTNGYAKRLKIIFENGSILKFGYLDGKNHIYRIKREYNIKPKRYESDRMERKRMSSGLHRAKKRRAGAAHSVCGRG